MPRRKQSEGEKKQKWKKEKRLKNKVRHNVVKGLAFWPLLFSRSRQSGTTIMPRMAPNRRIRKESKFLFDLCCGCGQLSNKQLTTNTNTHAHTQPPSQNHSNKVTFSQWFDSMLYLVIYLFILPNQFRLCVQVFALKTHCVFGLVTLNCWYFFGCGSIRLNSGVKVNELLWRWTRQRIERSAETDTEKSVFSWCIKFTATTIWLYMWQIHHNWTTRLSCL